MLVAILWSQFAAASHLLEHEAEEHHEEPCVVCIKLDRDDVAVPLAFSAIFDQPAATHHRPHKFGASTELFTAYLSRAPPETL